jgi:hypothetical protein
VDDAEVAISSFAFAQRFRGSRRRTLSVSAAAPPGPGARPVTTPKSDVDPLRHASGSRPTMTGSYSRASLTAASSSDVGA